MSSMYPAYGGPPSRRCLRCGIPLSPDVVNCGRCGAYNAIPQPDGSINRAQSMTNASLPWGGEQIRQESFNGGRYPGPWGQPSMPPQTFPPQNVPGGNAFAAPPSHFQRPSQPLAFPGNNFGQPGQYQQTGFNNYGSATQQNLYPYSPAAPFNGAQPGSSIGNDLDFSDDEQFSEEKKGPRVGLILGMLLLVALLIGGGFVGYTFVKDKAQNNNSVSTKSTPVVITTPTVKPLFSDTFVNNNAGWDLTSSPGKFSVKVGNGSMTLEDDENMLLPEVVPSQSFSNFRLDVDATLTKGDKNNGYGVYIRGGSSQDDAILGVYYRFELYGDGTYALFKGTLDSSGNSQSVKIQGYLPNAAITPEGHSNHITVIANGPDMTFMVNGQTIYKYHDTSYKGGSVALFVSNLPTLTPGAQATFSNLGIFPLS
jgi:hypothetical protein